ncbi:hypothetical protein [Paenibacillus kobensis]|uniref:hypothetical protein n=1 Tax=Paenibacillus kobensis TaxID=59841 RepID=UPI0013E33AC4|nr:hypothetical protein [Paenibacillus kobensis]
MLSKIRTDIPLTALWFVIPAVLCTILFIVIFWRKKDLKLWMLYLCLNAISLFLEDAIFIFLNSYEYKPGILKQPYADNALGAYFSQSYYITSIALLIAAYHLRFRWNILFTAMFVGIEYLFLFLGIYKLNWWHPAYTAVGLVIYFAISKKWYNYLLHPSSRLVRFFTLFCINYGNYAVIAALPVIFEAYRLAGGWFADPVRDTIAVIIVILLTRSSVIAVVCFCSLHWIIKAFVPVLLFVGYLVLIQLHIFIISSFWILVLFSSADIWTLLFCCYFNRKLLQSEIRKTAGERLRF